MITPLTLRADRTVSDAQGLPLLRFYADRTSLAERNLIAAAPELYEALAALRGNIGCASLVRNPVGIALRAQADAALAKARGEQ